MPKLQLLKLGFLLLFIYSPPNCNAKSFTWLLDWIRKNFDEFLLPNSFGTIVGPPGSFNFPPYTSLSDKLKKTTSRHSSASSIKKKSGWDTDFLLEGKEEKN